MTNNGIPYRIERTRNRNSNAVYKEDTIVIRLGRHLSARQEREHIENLLRRMTKRVLHERSKTSIDPFRPLFEGQSSLTLSLATGSIISFTLIPATRTSAKKAPDGWTITVAPQTRKPALHRFLWKLLSQSLTAEMDRVVRSINRDAFDVPIRTVRLRYATSQWGSCSRNGVVMLNTALLFVSPTLMHYVVVHELAHCVHANHSARYWKTVEKAFPRYLEARKKLSDFRICSL